MTEPLTIAPEPQVALIAIEMWDAGDAARLAPVFGGALPPSAIGSADAGGGWRVLGVEPGVWWLHGPRAGLADRLAQVEAALGDGGVAVDLTGGFVRVRLAGSDVRGLLMVGGVFDAEDPAFGPGGAAGTVLHHVAVRYDVAAEGDIFVFVPPSHLDDLLHAWRAAAARLDGRGSHGVASGR